MKVVSFIERDPETGLYVGIVPSIPGAQTQATTLPELYKNLKEVVELCLSEPIDKKNFPKFIGFHEFEV